MRRTRLILALFLLVGAEAATAQVARRPFLFKDARGQLAQARARGERELTLVIAAMPGANATLVRTITSLGGAIRYRVIFI